MKRYSRQKWSFGVKDFCSEVIKNNKIKCFILLGLTIISLFTGIIVAIKTQSISTFTKILGDEQKTLNGTNFFMRLLSMFVVLCFVVLGGFKSWLCPFAFLFIAYRAFLMGGNITLLIILNGISGIVVGLIVVLPCQLLTLLLFLSVYILLCDGRRCKREYGCEKVKNYKLLVVLFAVCLILILCLLESLLITMLSPTVIFVF